MDSIEVNEFLLSATGNSESLLLETDRIFDKCASATADANNSNQSSMYFSINDDTISNRLVDDLQRMDQTLTDTIEEESEQKTIELSSVIHINNPEALEEMSFQQSLPLKNLLFPNHPMRSQCSTPKIEPTAAPPRKTPQTKEVETASVAIPAPDLLMPLTKVLQKMEGKKKVTIVEENKENVQSRAEEEPQSKQAKMDHKPTKPTVAAQENRAKTGAVPKRFTMTTRKSMLPGAPSSTANTASAKGESFRRVGLGILSNSRYSHFRSNFKTHPTLNDRSQEVSSDVCGAANV